MFGEKYALGILPLVFHVQILMDKIRTLNQLSSITYFSFPLRLLRLKIIVQYDMWDQGKVLTKKMRKENSPRWQQR